MRELTAHLGPAAGGTGDARHSAAQDSRSAGRRSIVVKALRAPPWTEYGCLPASFYMCAAARK